MSRYSLPLILQILCAAIVIQNPRATAAQGAFLADATATPAGIYHVVAGGYWLQGDDEGFYRAVVVGGGTEHVVHRLFIQWIKISASHEPYKLIRTDEVEELSTDYGYVLDVTTGFSDFGTMELSVVARKSSSDGSDHFVVTAREDGTYTIEREDH